MTGTVNRKSNEKGARNCITPTLSETYLAIFVYLFGLIGKTKKYIIKGIRHLLWKTIKV